MTAAKHDESEAMYASLVDTVKLVDGKPTVVEDPYKKSMTSEEYDFETKSQKHKTVFFPVMTRIVGEKAIEAMKANKDLDQVSVEIPLIGKDHFDVTMNRSRQYRNPQDETAPIVKWGQVDAQLVTQAARSNRGEMSAVRDKLSAMALEALCK